MIQNNKPQGGTNFLADFTHNDEGKKSLFRVGVKIEGEKNE
jgi:hypothetical protein